MQFKQKCSRCRKNYVLVSKGTRFVVCYECQKRDISGPIDDPKMEKFFDIPEEFYRDNSFLRSVKAYYLKFKKISEKQETMFKKVVKDMKAK